jgi:hypothetical protein
MPFATMYQVFVTCHLQVQVQKQDECWIWPKTQADRYYTGHQRTLLNTTGISIALKYLYWWWYWEISWRTMHRFSNVFLLLFNFLFMKIYILLYQNLNSIYFVNTSCIAQHIIIVNKQAEKLLSALAKALSNFKVDLRQKNDWQPLL